MKKSCLSLKKQKTNCGHWSVKNVGTSDTSSGVPHTQRKMGVSPFASGKETIIFQTQMNVKTRKELLKQHWNIFLYKNRIKKKKPPVGTSQQFTPASTWRKSPSCFSDCSLDVDSDQTFAHGLQDACAGRPSQGGQGGWKWRWRV